MRHRHTARRAHTTWIVVADRSTARIFYAEWPLLTEFGECETLVQPEGTLHGRDVYPDRFGSNHAPDGHGFTDAPSEDFRHHTADRFARKIANRLEAGREHEEFAHLIIVAPPLMLGELRNHFPAPLKKLIESEIPKDLVQASQEQLCETVRQSLDVNRSPLA